MGFTPTRGPVLVMAWAFSALLPPPPVGEWLTEGQPIQTLPMQQDHRAGAA